MADIEYQTENLKFKKPRDGAGGAIEVDLWHEEFGWIPFGVSEDDVTGKGSEILAYLLENEVAIEPYSGPEITKTYRIAKTTPWRRMSDEEADAVETVIAQQPARMRQIYAAATYIDNTDPLWSVLFNVVTGLFGEERAKEILGPEQLNSDQ